MSSRIVSAKHDAPSLVAERIQGIEHAFICDGSRHSVPRKVVPPMLKVGGTNRCAGTLPRVNGSLFDETKGISPWVFGIERSLAPRAHDDATSRRIVNVLTR
jgi:hypothetical protein